MRIYSANFRLLTSNRSRRKPTVCFRNSIRFSFRIRRCHKRSFAIMNPTSRATRPTTFNLIFSPLIQCVYRPAQHAVDVSVAGTSHAHWPTNRIRFSSITSIIDAFAEDSSFSTRASEPPTRAKNPTVIRSCPSEVVAT